MGMQGHLHYVRDTGFPCQGNWQLKRYFFFQPNSFQLSNVTIKPATHENNKNCNIFSNRRASRPRSKMHMHVCKLTCHCDNQRSIVPSLHQIWSRHVPIEMVQVHVGHSPTGVENYPKQQTRNIFFCTYYARTGVAPCTLRSGSVLSIKNVLHMMEFDNMFWVLIALLNDLFFFRWNCFVDRFPHLNWIFIASRRSGV